MASSRFVIGAKDTPITHPGHELIAENVLLLKQFRVAPHSVEPQQRKFTRIARRALLTKLLGVAVHDSFDDPVSSRV
jgi:hypothetical protein